MNTDKASLSATPISMPKALGEHLGFCPYEWKELLERLRSNSSKDFTISYWRFIKQQHLKTAYCIENKDAEIEHALTDNYGPYFATADREQRDLSEFFPSDLAQDWKVFELVIAPR